MTLSGRIDPNTIEALISLFRVTNYKHTLRVASLSNCCLSCHLHRQNAANYNICIAVVGVLSNANSALFFMHTRVLHAVTFSRETRVTFL